MPFIREVHSQATRAQDLLRETHALLKKQTGHKSRELIQSIEDYFKRFGLPVVEPGPDPEKVAAHKAMRKRNAAILKILHHEKKTYAEVGKQFGISSTRVRDILQRWLHYHNRSDDGHVGAFIHNYGFHLPGTPDDEYGPWVDLPWVDGARGFNVEDSAHRFSYPMSLRDAFKLMETLNNEKRVLTDAEAISDEELATMIR